MTSAARAVRRPWQPVLWAALVVLVLGSTGLVVGQDAQETPGDEAPQATAPPLPISGPPLVGLDQVPGSTGEIRVAGMVDPASVSADGEGFSFALRDAGGNRVEVSGAGALPQGFDRAEVVVVRGAATGTALQAAEVLLPGAAEWQDPARGLGAVLAVNLIVWLGIFGYLLRLHGKVRQLEEDA